MSWAFPNRRLLPVLATALAYLVVCTAQRGVLLSVVRHEAQATAQDAFRAMMLGTQADLVAVASLLLPFTLWTLILPERAWRSSLHRAALNVVLTLAHAAILVVLVVESFYFLAHRTRFGPGSRDRLHAMMDFAMKQGDGVPAILAALAVGIVAMISVVLIHSIVRRAFEGARVSVGDRARDVVLHLLVAAALVALVVTREPEFPGRRSLQELTGNGMIRIGEALWRNRP
jgi:riboflavin transporter FmnP